ncbi:hypothetical protein [Actinobacillus equuli]|uniref:hypothetical protein n=1 Tax=Actinobacillus equuli TaxID=718 RepID=UPI002441A05D|nr:hypothetical protein [Actinobacillus equuli]WGE76065.1 hypothetical protein NYR81_03735 [Actinobacillus equuli subsp. haemolyticus]WGE78064.1 hypothetical protein NYR82_04285 [Actinobacillus equuli subsp. haemolyticus]
MKVNVQCKYCKSSNLSVRTSEALSVNTVKSIVFCNNCHRVEMTVISEITNVKLANYHESKEALAATKPLKDIDPNQQNLPI